ncbi:hypothetical protein VTK73DRAFT_1410 [Phialemonium thermophilum]|uniref:JmjC domain-containing protein n=1 Tax=Phialemonium thermophilum TaxID=223376 RepID=A0ABR3X9N9_9PEZI
MSRVIGMPIARIAGIRRLSTAVRAIAKSVEDVSSDEFRRAAFDIEQPLIMKSRTKPSDHDFQRSSLHVLLSKWFEPSPSSRCHLATSYLKRHAFALLPYELILGTRDQTSEGAGEAEDTIRAFSSWLLDRRQPDGTSLAHLLLQCTSEPASIDTGPRLVRFYAPLALFLASLEYNAVHSHQTVKRLYIAQAPLDTLPPELERDVVVPEIVKTAGRGDVYSSSIWLGLEPTYTPWHRDPNPNLFCQVCSSKLVRLLPPSAGEQVFREVQASLGKSSSSRIRGEEMMQGAERTAFYDAIWGTEPQPGILEADLGSGDGLFIPKGWWHSVKSKLGEGNLNVSINWWFR